MQVGGDNENAVRKYISHVITSEKIKADENFIFKWDWQHQKVFQHLTDTIATNPALRFYDGINF